MSIENAQVIIIIKNNQQREAVVQFMLENNINFQSGFDGAWEAQEIADELGYSESYEWQDSGC